MRAQVVFAVSVLFSSPSWATSETCLLWLSRCEFLRTSSCVQIKVTAETAKRLNRECLPPYIRKLQQALGATNNMGAVLGLLLED